MLTRRDRALAGALTAVLLVLVAVVAWPAIRPDVADVPSPSPSAPTARPYVEGFVGRPTSVSPFGASTPADRALVALVFSGLLRLGPGETLVPDLADHWSSDAEGRTYTFTLRADARWHDGLPVTADDVAFTVRSLQDPAYTGPGGASWRDVTVTVLDARTVRFELGDPIAGFLYAATQPIAPAHLLDGVPPEDLAANPFGQQPVGSGPYRLVSWNASEAVLEAAVPLDEEVDASPSPTSPDSLASPGPSPTPSRPLPYLADVEFRFSVDPATVAAGFAAGEIDAVAGLPPDLAAGLGFQRGSRLLRYPGSTLTAVLFDLRADRREFQDERTRLALLAAIDRDAIVAGQYAGLAARADAPIPPTSWAFDAAASPPVPHDPAAAASGLEAAGWRKPTDGAWAAPGTTDAYRLELIAPDEASNPGLWAVANEVADDWRAIGMTVDLVGLPAGELTEERLKTGEFAVALLDVAIGLDPDLYPLLASTQTVSGGANVSGIQDPTLDAKLIAARTPGPPAQRIAAYTDLQLYLAAEQPLLPLVWADVAVPVHDALHGPTVRRLGDGADRFYDVLTWRLADDR
jgi:peptide/nickel transport system substrate-binding protein